MKNRKIGRGMFWYQNQSQEYMGEWVSCVQMAISGGVEKKFAKFASSPSQFVSVQWQSVWLRIDTKGQILMVWMGCEWGWVKGRIFTFRLHLTCIRTSRNVHKSYDGWKWVGYWMACLKVGNGAGILTGKNASNLEKVLGDGDWINLIQTQWTLTHHWYVEG